MNVLIDRAAAADAANLADLFAAAMPPGWPLRDIVASCCNPNRIVLKAIAGEATLGLSIFQCAANEAELLIIAVADAAKRQGTGSRLLQAGLLSCKQRGVSEIYLEVSERNCSAFRLYRKHGFEEIGRRKNYYRFAGHGSETALIMRLDSTTGVEQIASKGARA